MVNQISIDNHKIVEGRIELDSINGFGAPGIPYLNIPVKLNMHPIEHKDNLDYSLSAIKASIQDPKSYQLITKAELDQPFNQRIKYGRGRDRTCNFQFPLGKSKIKTLENIRDEDLDLNLKLFITISLFENGSLTEYRNDRINFEFTVPQSHWIKNVLSKLNYHQYFLIEIPKGRKTVTKAWTLLEKAETNFAQSDYRALFQKCRDLGSLLNSHLKKKLGASSFSYKVKWERSYTNFYHYCSLGNHIEDMRGESKQYEVDEVKILKFDGEHMLLKAKALIKYAEELLVEKEAN